MLTEIDGKFNTQYLRADFTKDLDVDDLLIEWFIVNHEAYVFKNQEYYVSFEGEFTETITCNATNSTGSSISRSVEIQAAYGIFRQAGVAGNGIFNMSSFHLENVTPAREDLCDDDIIDGCYIYVIDANNELSMLLEVDRSIDLRLNWIMNEEIDNNPISIGSSLEVHQEDLYTITTTDTLNAVQLAAKCHADVIELIQPGQNQLRIEIEALSIGTIHYNLGNQVLELYSKTVVIYGVNSISYIEITYNDDAKLEVLDDIEFTVTAYPDNFLYLVDYNINWKFENGYGEFSEDNTLTKSYSWIDPGLHNVFVTLWIPEMNIEIINQTEVFLLDPTQEFEIELSTNRGETFEEFTFTVSNPDIIITGTTALRLKFSKRDVIIKELMYPDADPNLFNFSISETGEYTVIFELLRLSEEGDEILTSKEPMYINVEELVAYLARNILTEAFILQEVNVAINHNFASFPDIDDRLQFNWDFGDGQVASLNNPGDTWVRYTRPGVFNISCLIQSQNSPRTVFLSQNITISESFIETNLVCDNIVVRNSQYNCTIIINQGLPVDITIDFGDGQTQSNSLTQSQISVYHEYSAVGVYVITITSQNIFSRDQQTQNVTVVRSLPRVTISASSIIETGVLSRFSCWFETISLVDERYGSISFVWQFVNSTTGELINTMESSQANVSNTIGGSGTIDLTVTVSNGGECLDCSVFGSVEFLVIERITGLTLDSSREIVAPNANIIITPTLLSGSHITWMYQVLPDLPAWTEFNNSNGILEWTIRRVGIHQVKIQALNPINTVEASILITVIRAPEIENVILSSGDSGFTALNSTITLQIVMSEDSEEATEFEWEVRLIDNSYEVLAETVTTTPIWTFTLEEYGKYRFRLLAKNDVGESEPYPLTIEVYEPIENFVILPMTTTRSINAIALGEDNQFRTNTTLGNNITYTIYPYGLDGLQYPSRDGNFHFTYVEIGTFTFIAQAENSLSFVQTQLEITVQEPIFNIEIYHNEDKIIGNHYFVATPSLSGFAMRITRGSSVNYSWTFENLETGEERDFDTQAIESISFDTAGSYDIKLLVQNMVSVETRNVSFLVQNPLSAFPPMEFLNRIFYFDTVLKSYTDACTSTGTCIPVFNASDLVQLLFISREAPITDISILANGTGPYLSSYANPDGELKTFNLNLNKLSGSISLDITVSNQVSSKQKSIVIESHFRELNDLQIGPYDQTICLRNLSSPAAELNQPCTLILSTTTTIDNWQDFDVSWYQKVGNERIPINGSHSEGKPFMPFMIFTGNTGQTGNYTFGATVTSKLKDDIAAPEITIEIVPEIYFDGTTPKITLNNQTGDMKLYEQDCVEIRVNIDKYKNEERYQISPVDFDIKDAVTKDIIKQWSDTDGVITYQFMDRGSYDITATLSNKARLYVITKESQEINTGCIPPDLIFNEIGQVNNQPPDPIYKSRSVVIEISIQDRKLENGDTCNNRKNEWFLWKKNSTDINSADINCRIEGNTTVGSNSLYFDSKCVVKPEVDGLEPYNITGWDRGMSSLLIPPSNLDLGIYCFCFFTELQKDNSQTCDYEFGSWIGNEINVTHTPLVAYLQGATLKVENYVPAGGPGSCQLQTPINIDASKSFDPDIIDVNWLTQTSQRNGFRAGEDGLETDFNNVNCANDDPCIDFSWNCTVFNSTFDVPLPEESDDCNSHLAKAMRDFEVEACIDDDVSWMETSVMRACCNKAILQLNRKDPEGIFFIKENLKYMFNVTVNSKFCTTCPDCPSKDPVKETQIISFLAPSKHIVPDVEVRCNSCLSSFHKLVSKSSMVHMSAYEGNGSKLFDPKGQSELSDSNGCTHDDLDYLWTVYSTDKELPDNEKDYTEFPLTDITTTTGNRTKYLIIKQGVLDNNKFYHFNLSIPYDGEFKIISSYILKPNIPPHGGDCSFREIVDDLQSVGSDSRLQFPSNNSTIFFAAESKVEFHCSNWLAGEHDKPLTYALRATVVNSDNCIGPCTDRTDCLINGDVLYEGTQNIYQSFLPLGCQKLCMQILGKTGAASSSSCHYVNVGLNNVLDTTASIVYYTWFKSHKILKTLIDNKADTASIFVFSKSLSSILNGNKSMEYTPDILTKKRETRQNILERINGADYLGPHSLTEARQMASVVLSLVRYPNEFFDHSDNRTIIDNFYQTVGELIGKVTGKIMESNSDNYHLNNETMMATVDDIMAIMGYVLECTIIDDKGPDIVENRLFVQLFQDINNLTYQIGGWSVANEAPWRRENIGGSKLSLFQSRYNVDSFGTECDELLKTSPRN